MEHWNMTNPKLYEYFFENFSQERYTLEQAQYLSYIEMYLEENMPNSQFEEFKKNLFGSKETVAAIAKKLKEFGFPSLEEHKRKYRNVINKILSCTLEGLTLDICLDSSITNPNRKAYELTKNDLFFFNYLFVTRETENAKKLIKGEPQYYDQVDDDYYDNLKNGIKNLLSDHSSNYTTEDIEFCFEYKFRKARRRLLACLDHLNNITTEIANFNWENGDLVPTYKQCEAILEKAEAKLMKLRGNFFDDSTKSILVKLGIITEDS